MQDEIHWRELAKEIAEARELIARLTKAVEYLGTIMFHQLMLDTSTVVVAEEAPVSTPRGRHKKLVEALLKKVPVPSWEEAGGAGANGEN